MSQLHAFKGNFIDAGGIRTHYLEAGEGPTLVLIHGGGAGADGRSNFFGNIDLYARNFRVIAPDSVGFGETDQPSPETFEYSQATRTQHMIDFFEAMKLGPCHIVGNSMGGTTAMGLAIQRPDLVDTLCLMAGAANITHEDMVKNRQSVGALLDYDDTVEGMKRIIAGLTHDFTPSEEFIQYRYEMSIRPAAKAAYKSIMAWAGKNGLWYPEEAFRNLAMRTLVICGRDDVMVSLDKNVEMMRMIPNCRGYIMSQCGHWCMVERPLEFCDVTTRFFLDQEVSLQGA